MALSSTTGNVNGAWHLDESSSTRADSSGNSNDLSLTGTLGSTTGLLSGAALFDYNSANYLSHVDNASLSTGNNSWSISFWIKWTGHLTAYPGIISKGYAEGGVNREFQLYYDAAGYLALQNRNETDGTVEVHSSTFGAMTTGVWYNVTMGSDTSDHSIWVAVNGTKNKTATSSVMNGTNDGTGVFLLGTSAAYVSATGTDKLDAAIDELVFWKGYVLTAGDLTELYNGGAGVAYPWSSAVALQPRDLAHTPSHQTMVAM